uniref:Uncharacterized protein n=1 Tax=Castor canadensis TaxID=51338 RepID=A0A8C0XUJ1_CASCN
MSRHSNCCYCFLVVLGFELSASHLLSIPTLEPCFHPPTSFFFFPPKRDECYQVRQVFAQKLHKGLSRLRLPLEYMAICALCAKDPVKERRAHARQCLVKNINVRREYLKQHAAVSGKYIGKVNFSSMPVSVL